MSDHDVTPSPVEPAPPPSGLTNDGPGSSPDSRGADARSALLAVRAEVAKAVVGQDAAVAGLLVALLCRGHILLEGVPGVAKTLLVRSLAAALDVGTKRVQFTPDLMPGDLTGSLVFDARTSDFTFRHGPVFTNLMLADEINRTPPKTQSALLEAMEERQVSVDGAPHALPSPFMVAATQNPVEYEGTYPLPEAQLDRFLLKVVLPLPQRSDEVQVLRRHASGFDPRDLRAAGIRPVATAADLDAGVRAVRSVAVSDEVAAYIVDIARATRVSPSLSLGVSPRGATALMSTSRAWAWLAGRSFVTPDDVKALAHATLAHRLSLRPEAELEGVVREARALAAELDDGPRIGMQGLDSQRDGVHLLDELRTEGLFEGLGARSGDESPNVLAAELLEDSLDAHHEVENALGLLGVMALVVTPDDVFGVGIDQDGFDGRGPYVQTYYCSQHIGSCALPS